MDEYINRNTLLNKVIEEKRFVVKTEDLLNNEVVFTTVYGDFADVVYSIPVDEDVVKVVRCKNCKYFKTSVNKENYCDIHSSTWDKFYVRLDDYCSMGERR